MLVASAVGLILQFTGSYVAIFAWAGFSCLFILGLIQIMIPRIEPVPVE
jgi:ACS family hexuronate transporter-like MFS transporter